MGIKLPLEFYQREDVLQISRELLGKALYTDIDGVVTGGIIVETEAYMAPIDKASHAYGNRRTPRTQIFYLPGGRSYVYMCYGIHFLFNIITNKSEVPHAILIRAIEPLVGVETMMFRRKKQKLETTLTAGPGALSQALGINKAHNNISLEGNTIWLEDYGNNIEPSSIIAGPRVGISYAEEFALKPWRFSIKDNPWVSKAK